MILLGLLVEGVLVIVMAGLAAPALAEKPRPGTSPVAEDPTRLLNNSVSYTRVQTVTLQPLSMRDIYATIYTTTFQFEMLDYELPRYVQVPTDAIVHEVSCSPIIPPCNITFDRVEYRYTFSGTGKARVYLHYDAFGRAMRSPGSRLVTLQYPAGPRDRPDEYFQLTNTIRFGRPFDPKLTLWWADPPGYVRDKDSLLWVLPSTPRLTFTVAFTEPLLGADLVIDRLEVSTERPAVGQMVRYTAVVRNQGDYETGRPVLAELFVRPYVLGPPVVLTDHVGGWLWVDEQGNTHAHGLDALFKWYFQLEHQIYLPLVLRASTSGCAGAAATDGPWVPGSWWWPGLKPEKVITGTTAFPWPEECGAQVCGVWAKVDPTYLEFGGGYEWYGSNPEGLNCHVGIDGLPTCEEERNNIAAAFTRFLIYLPAVLRGQ